MDVLLAEVIRRYLEALAEEMSQVVQRTAMSPVFNEVHDYSTGVFHFDGKEVALIARAVSATPDHIFASVSSVSALLQEFKNDLHAGDLIVLNDPYAGGTHLQDWTIMRPVFHSNKPIFFPSIRAHMLDTGGPRAGAFNFLAREVWHEGFRLPPLKLYDKGQLRRDVMDMLVANNRLPDMLRGDLDAIRGSCEIAERRIHQLVAKYGLETVQKGVAYTLDYSERRFRQVVSAWPDGEYAGESTLDTDFAGTRDIKVRAKVTVAGDQLSVDFTGSHPQAHGPINSPVGNSMSDAYCAICTVLPPDIPINSGIFRACHINCPAGTVVNPRPPFPTGSATVMIGADIGEAVMKALEKIVPERVCNTELKFPVWITVGNDPRHGGQLFVHVEFWGAGTSDVSGAHGMDGWGAGPASHSAMTIANIEMIEVQYPVTYLKAEYGIDTAGAGEWRGSPAMWVNRITHAPSFMTVGVQGHRNPYPGYVGGRPGAPTYVVLNLGTADERMVTESADLYMSKPDELDFAHKGGGGGWGNPLARDPGLVLQDVLNGYVSVEGAARDYGVVIDTPMLTVDETRTYALRERRS